MRRTQGELVSSEEKLRGLQSEARQLKVSIKKYENLMEKYKRKVKSDPPVMLLQFTQLKLQRTNMKTWLKKPLMIYVHFQTV